MTWKRLLHCIRLPLTDTWMLSSMVLMRFLLTTIRTLIAAGADVLAQDEEGSAPLHKAAFSGKAKVVEELLENGAEVDCQDADDGTPLHNACFNGHLDCVKLLLNNQANLNCAGN